MDSSTTHHVTSNPDNLAIHSEYHGPEEVTLGNGSNLPISHIGKRSLFISDKSYVFDSLLHVPLLPKICLFISSFTNSNQLSVEFFPHHFLIKDLAVKAVLHKEPNEGCLYFLPIWKFIFSPTSYAPSLGVWHALLANASYPIVRQSLTSGTVI